MTAALFFSWVLQAQHTRAGEMREPWATGTSDRIVSEPKSTEVLVLSAALRWFQLFVSPVDGPRCHLYPTCSEFAKQSIQRYGVIVGIVLTTGRLTRDNSSAARFYPRRLIGGRVLLFDPPERHWPPFRRSFRGPVPEADGVPDD